MNVIVDFLVVLDLDYIEFLIILRFKYRKVYKTQVLRFWTRPPTLRDLVMLRCDHSYVM